MQIRVRLEQNFLSWENSLFPVENYRYKTKQEELQIRTVLRLKPNIYEKIQDI